MGDIDKVSKFIEECYRNDITVDAPNINTGEGTFVARDGRIQYGMEAIKGVGSNAVEALVKERDENVAFTSVFDFSRRVSSRTCNKRTMESLIQAGAFDSFNENRRQLLENTERILRYGSHMQEIEQSDQSDLFGDGGGSASAIEEPSLEAVQPWSNMERLNKERELIGFYLSGHPLNNYKEDIRLFCSHSFDHNELGPLKNGTKVRCAGIIEKVKRTTDRNNLPIAFVKAVDIKGNDIEIAVFNDTYDRCAGMIEENTRVVVEGEKDDSRGKLQLIATSFERIEKLREKYQHKMALKLDIDTQLLSDDDLHQLAELFQDHRGETNVQFKVMSLQARRPFAMHVRKFVVEPNEELLSGLKLLLGNDAVRLAKTK
jgi:DNA polymerase-3 subunit alpha